MTFEADAPARVPLQELVGSKLGEYRVVRVLGHGSMGVVFEALHEQLGRRVALKALPPGLGATEKAIQRFLREAQAVAQLSHENIVPIYEIAREGTVHYYAMQFLEGEPLDRVIRGGPLAPRRAAQLALTAARAIHFAHQRGIIHRDIKPANLIVQSDGRLVLTDFGLARPEQGGGITDSGAMVGTPLYMSPEQVRARKGEIDRRTDVYSLGATLYEMLAGRPPFTGESTQEILQAILEQEPRSPRAWSSAIPADLDVITMRAIEKEPRRRYQSALELAQDLERFLEGEPILARRTTIVARAWRRVRKHRTTAVLAVLLFLVALGFSTLFKLQRDSSRRRDYDEAFAEARVNLADENFLRAFDKFDAALVLRPDDLDARLGRARARCFLGQVWERANEEQGKEARPELKDRFGSVDQNYADALTDVSSVADARPDDSLALFYRGFLRWRLFEKLEPQRKGKPEERVRFLDDLSRAESIGADDWETQLELTRFRFGLAKDQRRDADQRNELLQSALNNASRAIKQADARQQDDRLAERGLARAYKLRAETYLELYDLVGNAFAYLGFAKSDAERSRAIDPSDSTLGQILDLIESRIDDYKKSAAPAEPAASTDAPAAERGELATNVLALLGVAEKSEQSKVLAKILTRGGQLLAEGWQETDDLRAGFMDSFVNPYLPRGTEVSDADRDAAAAEAESARRILQAGLARGDFKPEERRAARDHLARAVEKNPRSAQYLFELAVVEQDLAAVEGDRAQLELAREHLDAASRLAPSNPVFFHQLALVCEQLERFDEALASARKTCELADGNADFLADRARLALACAAQHEGDEKARPLVAEARRAVETLVRDRSDHPQLAALQARLAELAPREDG